jgi:hypothetical protein
MKYSKYWIRTRLFDFRFLIVFLFLATKASSQSRPFVSAYKDYRNYLFAFSEGISRQIDSRPVRTYKSRGDKVVYVDVNNNLMLWQNDIKTNLGDATSIKFLLTDELLIYTTYDMLAVADSDKTTNLTYFFKEYDYNAGMVAFTDQNIGLLKAYTNGKVIEVEATLIGKLGKFKVGENILAYINSSDSFKIYYNNELYSIDNLSPDRFLSGKNLVAYIEGSTKYLNVFYKGKVFVLEEFEPISFQVGDEAIAYVTNENSFKVFQSGKLLKVESYAPSMYAVRDNTVLFFFNNELQILQNGVRFVLDQFAPLNYQMSQDRIAWQDQAKRLYIFADGKTKLVTTETITAYELNGDILRYDVPDGTSRIYYKGKTY